MIKSVLIANRGEIACRIIRTAKKLGIKTVAVYSDADANAPHARLADAKFHIGPPPPAESYLVGKKIIAAAREAGAESIHPGYGFLSENAEFAQSVIDAGLVWVGPPPQAIQSMGLKHAAKSLMMAANVPTTPGYLGKDQSLKVLKTEAGKIGYPVLIKAVAGGGGKGMRRVDKAADFDDALLSCQREAKASFGDDHVLLEKWITNPRHIEVQIFGDSHGNHIHLFERDCTLQRRHQKVIEEAPAPGMDEQTRQAVCSAAVRAAEAVDYVGAGTVEFIADGSGKLDAEKIWFIEMNTRLQVEHPVTELITGVDLVEWQLRVASGERVPKLQDEITINGWAMEARLYAENPSTGFLPSIGTLEVFELPNDVRIDTGVEAGGEVSPFYDPLISKLISHGANRDLARSALASACDRVVTYPVQNNAGFIARLLREDAFAEAVVTTSFIGDNLDRLTERPEPPQPGLAIAASRLAEAQLQSQLPERSVTSAVWTALSGFRLSSEPDLRACIDVDGVRHEIPLAGSAENEISAFELEDRIILLERGWPFEIRLPRHELQDANSTSSGELKSPMPGRVITIAVAKGDRVEKGQRLVTLEAMKMEHSLDAPFDGVVAEIAVSVDDQIAEGTSMMTIAPEEEH